MGFASCIRFGMDVPVDASSASDVEPYLDLEVPVDAGIDAKASVDSSGKMDSGAGIDTGASVDSSGKTDSGSGIDAGVSADSTGKTDSGSGIDAGASVDSSGKTDSGSVVDQCPNDDKKLLPGICGCGVADTDSDGDGTPDCNDGCPNDPKKTAPATCGCGVVEMDVNNNGVCENWVLPLWSYRRALIIGSRAPAATHSNFPILIDIQNDTSLRDHARSDGHDIRFTTENGVTLEHETETYDPVTGSLLAWVKLPSLDTGSDTLLLLYYGNGTAAADPSVTTVWSNAYIAVWHLGESGSSVVDEFYDSSGGGNHAQGGGGVKKSTPARLDGKIGYGQDGDGIDDFIATPVKLAGQSLLTVTAWFHVRRTDNIVRPGLLGQNNALEIGFYWTDRLNVWTPTVTTKCPGKGIISACTADFLLNTWMHLAVVFDGANATLYIDGVQKHVAVSPNVGNSSFFFNLMGRVFENTGNHIDGMLDEVRLAQTKRSAAWIATQHATQSDPASFYSLGPEQQAP